MEFLKNFNGFEKLFQNTIDQVEAKMHDFGPERGHFGGQSSKYKFFEIVEFSGWSRKFPL